MQQQRGQRFMDRDILLIVVGGLIGAVSSFGTIFVTYYVEGLRLKRLWQREDQLLMRQKREELEAALSGTSTLDSAGDE